MKHWKRSSSCGSVAHGERPRSRVPWRVRKLRGRSFIPTLCSKRLRHDRVGAPFLLLLPAVRCESRARGFFGPTVTDLLSCALRPLRFKRLKAAP